MHRPWKIPKSGSQVSGERIFTEALTSDRKMKASLEGLNTWILSRQAIKLNTYKLTTFAKLLHICFRTRLIQSRYVVIFVAYGELPSM